MVAVCLGVRKRGTVGATRPGRPDPLAAPGSPWRRPSSRAPARTCGGRALPRKAVCSDEVLGDVSRENEVSAAGGQNLAERDFDPRTFGL